MLKLKLFLKLCSFFTLFWATSLFCKKATADFSIYKITTNPSLSLSNQGDEANIKHLFNQSFSYLGAGGQTFVFASEDGKYVIKIFKNSPNPLIFLKKYKQKKNKNYCAI